MGPAPRDMHGVLAEQPDTRRCCRVLESIQVQENFTLSATRNGRNDMSIVRLSRPLPASLSTFASAGRMGEETNMDHVELATGIERQRLRREVHGAVVVDVGRHEVVVCFNGSLKRLDLSRCCPIERTPFKLGGRSVRATSSRTSSRAQSYRA